MTRPSYFASFTVFGVLALGWAMTVVCPALAAEPVPGSLGLFVQKYSGSRNDFSGQVGFAFVPATPLSVTALGRSVSGGPLQRPHPVTLWDPATERPLARVTISTASRVDEHGFAFERLAKPVLLEKGRSYRLTSGEEKSGDPMLDLSDIRAHLTVADVGPGVFSVGDGYPKENYGSEEQGYGLPIFYFEATGIAPGLLKVGPRGPVPFVGDLATGYLMNCSFRAIRPYIWKQTPRLTGWETDSTGGGWEEKPGGFFPNDFAFHVESFRLRDTNNHHAVTIRHQFARQTEGRVTWEFRFMLPAAMEDAVWQLRDLKEAAVSLITHDGKLCYERGGEPVALLPVALGHEYGIKVVADVPAHRADIYVDGELKAKAAPFARPVDSLDYVLIKTGDAAVGDMLLPLVNVHRGYAVCETFATCGVGRAPDDWEITRQGGTATVGTFACAAKPDVFSLKLADGVAATKHFDAVAGKTVCEFRFLVPEMNEGVAAELLGEDRPACRFVITRGDLCCLDPQGRPMPIVKDYRANLWYAVKTIADPKSGTAEVFVNGKLAQPKISFARSGKSFDGVRFSQEGQGTLWLDDVRVYPWQDYPADYVPEPKPVAVTGGQLLGVQSCSLWKEGDAYAGWDYVRPFAKRRKPYLGWYDEGRPEVANWEIKWQVEHGIGFEMYCWYRPNDAVNHPIKEGVLEHGIREGLFNARYSRLKKFAIMYTNQGAGDTNPDDWRKHIIPYWIEYFFKDPRYLKVGGKPVISIYYPDNYKRDFGGVSGGKRATDVLREACAQAGFPGVIILMELRSADPKAMQEMKTMGGDCCYAYTWGTGDVARQRQQNLAQRDAAVAGGFQMIPSVSVGWQTAPWDGSAEGNGWAPAPSYKALAQWVKDEFMPTLPEDSLGRKMVLLPNWNEFGEGHFMMPSALAGFGYLEALREVFTTAEPHQDPVPTDTQKRRFTVLYPKN